MKVKICGLSCLADIEAVNAVRPDWIGFVFAKKSRRYIRPEQAALLKERLNQAVKAAGVFVDERMETILDLAEHRMIDIIQLHGNEDVEFMNRLKYYCDIPVVKAISMTEEDFEEKIYRWEGSSVDYLLLDSGGGGTGRQFDYSRITKIVKPFFLAGGLTPENVEGAVLNVRPFGVDISSGVETEGRKDGNKIEAVVRRIRNAEGKIW